MEKGFQIFTKLLISSFILGLSFFAIYCKSENEKIIYSCTLEKWNDTVIFADSDTKLYYKQKALLSKDEFLSGNYSLKLDSINIYALTTRLKLKANKKYVVTLWKKSTTDKLLLVASSANNVNDFYLNSKRILIEGNNGWKQIILEFQIPEKLNNQLFDIYVWNNSKEDVYIDDFQIIEKNINAESK